MTQQVFACNWQALDAAGRARHTEVARALRGLALGVSALPDGLALRLPAGESALRLAAEFISRERLCCPFFTFHLEVRGEAALLRLGGPPGAGDFIAAEFGEWLQGAEPA
jgi:hypothetical protein